MPHFHISICPSKNKCFHASNLFFAVWEGFDATGLHHWSFSTCSKPPCKPSRHKFCIWILHFSCTCLFMEMLSYSNDPSQFHIEREFNLTSTVIQAIFWQQQSYFGVDLTPLQRSAYEGYFSQVNLVHIRNLLTWPLIYSL